MIVRNDDTQRNDGTPMEYTSVELQSILELQSISNHQTTNQRMGEITS